MNMSASINRSMITDQTGYSLRDKNNKEYRELMELSARLLVSSAVLGNNDLSGNKAIIRAAMRFISQGVK